MRPSIRVDSATRDHPLHRTGCDIEIVDLYDERTTIGEAIADATSHADRHLGMIGGRCHCRRH